jgi:hypothetical protein
MEYRYYFNHDKPIVPLMYRQAELPVELDSIQYLDFTDQTVRPYETLFGTLTRRLVG